MGSHGSGQGEQHPLDEAIAHARHILPVQGPIGVFVHHNTLHAFQHMQFHEALRAASDLHGTEGYLSEAQYRGFMAEGRIEEQDVEFALAQYQSGASDEHLHPLTRRNTQRVMLLVPCDGEPLRDELWAQASTFIKPREPSAFARLVSRVGVDRTQRDLLLAMGAEDPCRLSNPVLVDFLGAFLDEGMARWHMPGREQGILACFRSYLGVWPGLLPAWLKAVKSRLDGEVAKGRSAREMATDMLGELGVTPDQYMTFVVRILLELPGFTGMVSRLEATPGDRDAGAPPCSLLETLVLRLALDLEAYRVSATAIGHDEAIAELRSKAPRFERLIDDVEELERVAAFCNVCRSADLDARRVQELGTPFIDAVLKVVDAFDEFERRRVWHEAYERQHLREVCDALAINFSEPVFPAAKQAKFQVAFCIDDREESIRRYFEELDDAHVTYGVAGFFGVAMRFRGVDDPMPAALCPVVVTPAHAIHERPLPQHGDTLEKRMRMRRWFAQVRHELGDGSRALMRGVALTPLLGMLSVFPLAFRILFPHTAARLTRWVASRALPAPRTELVLDRDLASGEDEGRASLPLGFTLSERADRVQGTLENIGLVKEFAPIVAMLGHGASTVNNPHHSAYDCGACGGRNGGPNGRAFAIMANDAAVRAELRKRGIDIPDSTWFVGGWHDTTTDAVYIADQENIPEAFHGKFAELMAALDKARALSAQERCRKFEHAPDSLTPEQALAHVEERAVDLSQARPELGHVTNAVAIVGRRSLSRGIFLDRRSFLISYDAAIDPEVKILARILGAVVPVGAGINLEYYFSTIDNEGYGCGTKLPHNLACLLGVMEGASGDLRTGLPRQMIEIHEPVRLLSIIDATPEAILQVAARNAEVAELVTKGWVRVVSVHPETGELRVFQNGAFELYTPTRSELPSVRNAAEWYQGKIGFLSPVRIVKHRERAA